MQEGTGPAGPEEVFCKLSISPEKMYETSQQGEDSF